MSRDVRLQRFRAALLRSASIALALAVVGCSGDEANPDPVEPTPPPPSADPGPLQLRLSGPEPVSRAVLVEIGGAGIDSVTTTLGVVAQAADAGSRRLVLRGPVGSGSIGTVWMADRARQAGVTARVTQAVGDDYRQRDVSAFTLTLVR